MTARTWPSITSSDSIGRPGGTAGVHRSPPSVVSHRPSPNTNPTRGLANRIPHTARPTTAGCGASGAAGAGSPRQLAPRSRVRRIDVHGAFAHGAVPRTNASSVETNVTEVAANPIGTGPPDGTATVDVLAAVAGAAGVEEAAPRAAGAAAELAPPDPAGPLDERRGRRGGAARPRARRPAGRQRHRRQQGAAREPDPCHPQRCVHGDPLAPSIASYGYGDARAPLRVRGICSNSSGRRRTERTSANGYPVGNAGALPTAGKCPITAPLPRLSSLAAQAGVTWMPSTWALSFDGDELDGDGAGAACRRWR